MQMVTAKQFSTPITDLYLRFKPFDDGVSSAFVPWFGCLEPLNPAILLNNSSYQAKYQPCFFGLILAVLTSEIV
jgi:hypothetical protein